MMTFYQAFEALVDFHAKELRTVDDQFVLELVGRNLACYVRGQQGGWQVSPIPLDAAWVVVRHKED